MKIINKKIEAYTFDELSDTAKDKVRQWVDTFEFNVEYVLEDFQTIVGILGFYDVDPRYSGFCSQGDGASFTGRYRYAKGTTKAIREYAGQDTELHRIADGLQLIQRKNFYRVCARLSLGSGSNFYCHENTISIEVYNSENEYQDVPQSDDFIELCRDLMRWLYKKLEAEYDWGNADEQVSETCASNKYLFDINGNPIH